MFGLGLSKIFVNFCSILKFPDSLMFAWLCFQHLRVKFPLETFFIISHARVVTFKVKQHYFFGCDGIGWDLDPGRPK